jgi:hypothetical protein
MNLGQMTVNLALTGLDSFHRGMNAAKDVTEALGRKAASMGGVIVNAMQVAQNATMNFVRAGLAGTVEGNRMAFMWQQMSRQIAALFLPVIQKVTETIGHVVAWFHKLSGAQQDQIMKWGLMTVGVLAFTKALSAMGLLVPVISAVGAALRIALGAINPVLLAVVAIGAAIAAVSAVAENGLGGMAGLWEGVQKAAQPVVDALSAVWKEIAPAFKSLWETLKGLGAEFGNLAAAVAGLTGDGIMAFAAIAVPAFQAVLFVVEKVVQAVTLLVRGVTWLVGKLRDLLALAGIAAPPPAEAAVNADQPPKPADNRRDVTVAPRGFEGVTSAFTRVQEAINKRFDPAQAAADQKARDLVRNDKLDAIKDAIDRKNGGLAA